MINFVITNKNKERMLDLVKLAGSNFSHYTRICHYGNIEIRDLSSQRECITNYNGLSTFPEKADK